MDMDFQKYVKMDMAFEKLAQKLKKMDIVTWLKYAPR